jgi:hypothetical protein
VIAGQVRRGANRGRIYILHAEAGHWSVLEQVGASSPTSGSGACARCASGTSHIRTPSATSSIERRASGA